MGSFRISRDSGKRSAFYQHIAALVEEAKLAYVARELEPFLSGQKERRGDFLSEIYDEFFVQKILIADSIRDDLTSKGMSAEEAKALLDQCEAWNALNNSGFPDGYFPMHEDLPLKLGVKGRMVTLPSIEETILAAALDLVPLTPSSTASLRRQVSPASGLAYSLA